MINITNLLKYVVAAAIGGSFAGVGYALVKRRKILSSDYNHRKENNEMNDFYYDDKSIELPYFYEVDNVDEENTIVEAIISLNKLPDLLRAIKHFHEIKPIDTLEPYRVIPTQEDHIVKVMFEATYDDHMSILNEAGIDVCLIEE